MVSAGMIKTDGSIYPVTDHQNDLTRGGLTRRLRNEVRFRANLYQTLVFETLSKRITAKQKNTMFRYIRFYKNNRIAVSVDKEYVEVNTFLGMSINPVKQFIAGKVR